MTGSLLGKVLRNQGPPVPMSGAGFYKLPGLAMSGNDNEAYMRAFGTVGTVWQIVHLLSSATAGPVWKLYRQDNSVSGHARFTTSDQGSDQRQEVTKHQALSVLTKPNAFCGRFRLFEQSQQYLDLTGESYWVVEYDPRANFPVGLWPVRPDRLEPVPDPDTYLKGYVYTAPDGREKVPLQVRDVIQTVYPNPLDQFHGLGPVQAILVDIDASRYSAEWNRNFFINSAVPGGVIQVDHSLSDDEWNQLTDRWRESHRGTARSHRVAVLEAGATWVPNQMSMRDMDFGNLRNVSRDIIREAFGIHKVMLGVSDDVNRANAQTGEEVFATWMIAPRLDRWKTTLNEQFLPLFGSAGEGVEFDYIYPRPQNREQDNAELTTKTTAALALIQAGYDPHDVLEVVGLPDMDVAETAVQAPALPPGWVPGTPPGGAPAGPAGGEAAAESAGGGDDPVARLRKMLANGHVPVSAGSPR